MNRLPTGVQGTRLVPSPFGQLTGSRQVHFKRPWSDSLKDVCKKKTKCYLKFVGEKHDFEMFSIVPTGFGKD